ncbi:hypothetical protein [Ottowia thiooxydans]|uniref:Uncharacterized protein n=1 Tax=Ottowia thiooxydans TaxID=219182 RepID=A0ABV2Q322_9BURK
MDNVGSPPEGISISFPPESDAHHMHDQVTQILRPLGGLDWCMGESLDLPQGRVWRLRLKEPHFEILLPSHDTLGLRQRLTQITNISGNDLLMLEVWVALLGAPVRIDFADLDELQAHVRIRCNIARAAEKTALAFKTDAAERPSAFWQDQPGTGFLLKPEASLTDALTAATQPERTGRLYEFSCYRATEYVILLGIAQEAECSRPGLYEQLERTARTRCIKSGSFHEVFLSEYGTADVPIPMNYYVPGDRVWFKNPDEPSSNASGYEGSWVIYLGDGCFSNFWKRDSPYTLQDKMLEIYHWRDGAYLDDQSMLQMNEKLVEDKVASTQKSPDRAQQVLNRMMRYRDLMGVYSEGGSIDSSREFPRDLSSIAASLAKETAHSSTSH